MTAFFCTRCGTALELPRGLRANTVCCPSCSALVRTPWVDLPFARRAAFPPVPLHYASPRHARAWSERFLEREVLAERLRHVVDDEPAGERTGMTDCPCCGSTIAAFTRKCPFCRNALAGPLSRFGRG